MSDPSSPGESQCGAPRFFVGCAEDESEGLDDYASMRTDMELYEDDLEDDSVQMECSLIKCPVYRGILHKVLQHTWRFSS